MPLDQTVSSAGRRDLLRTAGLGAAALGTVAAGVVARPTVAAAATTVTDTDVLNFALNLEYLEAEFYLRAVTGQGLTDAEAGPGGTATGGGTVTGGTAVPFQNLRTRDTARDIAQDEHQHVLFLRAALGSSGVGRPQIDFASSFTTLARVAGIAKPTETFDPFADDLSFLLGAYVFEDVGVTAYHGGARLLKDVNLLSYAAGILAVEAYHAGVIRANILRATNQLIADAGLVSRLRSKLSDLPKGQTDDSGPVQKIGEYNLVPTDANSIAFERTPRQVLNIVYGGVNATSGLFFPAGMNGVVK